MLRVQKLKLSVLLLCQLFQPVDFHLSHIEFVQVLIDLKFDLLVGLFLIVCHSIELHRHFLDGLCLCMIDIGLASDVFVALFYLELGRLELLRHISL